MGSVDAWQLAIAEAQHPESPARRGQRLRAGHGGPGLHWGRPSGSGAHSAACLPTAPWDTDWGKADASRGRLALASAPWGVRSSWPLSSNKLFRPETLGGRPLAAHGSYLVDSASSHMLVSKIKPCMSKYKQLYSETANGSLNQLSFI